MSNLSPERWEEVSAILDEALELPAEEVPALLAERCRGNPELRREVEQMLDACARAEHLMDRPPALAVKGMLQEAMAGEGRGQLEPGDLIGAYRIVELLGRGGMGAVYLAERADGEFERQVALKVVKRGMDSEEILDRFRSERQILAGLEHPNIAGLLDGGITPDGRPFFAMELAIGEPIDQYCDRLRLPLRKRVELFAVVCEAVQHAHRNLVVHRDLKPGNIIVTGQGEVKLLDFGIAKVLDPAQGNADRTRALGVRLTPEYAAPEQVVNGPTTTATDVYALGIVLYELLSGQRPYVFAAGTLQEIEDLVCNTDPRRPSTRVIFRDPEAKEETGGLPRASWLRSTSPDALRQSLSGDLDSIILKALEKEPARRYGTAAELRQDLFNHLEGRPVEAHAQTRLYRMGKFIRRNRVVVSLGTAAALALVVGAGLATAFGLKAQRLGRLAEVEGERAEKTRDFVVSLFDRFDPDTRSGQDLTPQRLVAEGISILDTLQGQPLLKSESLNALGQIAFNLGQRNLADSIFSLALLVPIADTNAVRAVHATALGWRARILNERRDSTGLALLRRAIALRRHSATSDPLLSRDLISLAFALTIHYPAGSPGRAEARDLLHQLDGGSLDAADEGTRLELLGDLWLYERQWDSARVYYQDAIAARTTGLGSNHPGNGETLLGLGEVFLRSDRPREAEASFREAANIFTHSYGDRHPRVANAYVRLARALMAQDRLAEAGAAAAASLAALNPQDETNATTEAGARELLARSLFLRGRASAALPEAIRAAELSDRTVGLFLSARVQVHLLVGQIQHRLGRDPEAVLALRTATAFAAPPEETDDFPRYTEIRNEALALLSALAGGT